VREPYGSAFMVCQTARLAMVKRMTEAIVARWEINRWLGKHWITRFLSRHPDLAVKLSSRLDRQ